MNVFNSFSEKLIEFSFHEKNFRFLSHNNESINQLNLGNYTIFNNFSNSTNKTETKKNFTEINLISIENAWIGGILCSVGLYILSVILTFLVLMWHRKTKSKNNKNTLIYCLIALSIGTLIGDAIIHLLPECYGLKNIEENNIGKIKPDKNLVSFFIIFGFIAIYIFEKILFICGIGHSHAIQGDENHFSHYMERSRLMTNHNILNLKVENELKNEINIDGK